MHRETCYSVLMVLAVLAAPLAGAIDSEMVQAGRAIVESHKDAVITVQVVLKVKFQNDEREMKRDVIGTVIDKDGLTVVALSSIDISSIMGNMGGPRMQFESSISSIDLLLPGGKELPAKEMIRDNELDLAYIRPVQRPEAPMPFVDFADSGDVEILDYVVALNRLGQVANRVHAAAFEQIEGVVRRPRTFYVPSSSVTNTNQGNVAFNLEGKVVGLFVLRSIQANAGSENDNVAGIILPAADILDGAEQAPGFDE